MSSLDPVGFLEDTVRIPSHESIEEIRGYLLDHVRNAEIHDSGCVVASKGSGEPKLLLNTHMDVVSPHIEYRRRDDVIMGRGACDAKASLAVMATAFNEVEPTGTVELVVSPDEETSSVGLYEYVGGGIDASMAVVGEPTGLDICTAARGRYEVEVDFRGESAHAASGTGINAVSCAAEAVQRLESMENMTDPVLGESTLTVTRISGGGASNQVPDKASLFIDRRSVPPESQHDFLDKVKQELNGLECGVEARFSTRPTPFLEAFRTDEDEEVVQALYGAVEEAVGEPEIRAFDAATEASYIAREVPTVVWGPGAISEDGEPVAHSEREYVSVEEVKGARDALTSFIDAVV